MALRKRGNFLNLVQKEGLTRKGGGVPSEKGGLQPCRKLCNLSKEVGIRHL